MCLKDMTRATLWRADMTKPVTMTLSHMGKSVPLSFSAGQAVKTWPVADMPLMAGGEYRISAEGGASATVIRIASFPTASTAPEDVAGALIGQGCTAQLDALVEAGKTVVNSG